MTAPVDWIIVAVLAAAVFTAAKRGFFVTLFSVAGIVAGVILASHNYHHLAGWVVKIVPRVGIAEAVSFLAIALAVMIASGIAGKILRAVFRFVGLGWADWLLGAALGLVQGAVLVTIGVMALAAFLPHLHWFQESRLAGYFLTAAHRTASLTPADFASRVQKGVKSIRETQLRLLQY